MNSTQIRSPAGADDDRLVTEIHIDAPPGRVFRALTDQGELARWFTDPKSPVHAWQMDARPGGEYRYFVDEKTAAENKVSALECRGRILEFEPPGLLSYTWMASWHRDPAHATVVRWELTPFAGGTLVRVTHSGLAAEDAARQDYRAGWPEAVALLRCFAEGENH